MDREIQELLRRSLEAAPVMRRGVIEIARERGLPVASHDDASEAHIDECVEVGITILEFPTTLRAARVARASGIRVIMGDPNLMRGGSYSGNVGAAEVLEAGCLDIVASDYVPRSMLESAFRLGVKVAVICLPPSPW